MWTGAETEINLMLIRHGMTRSNAEHRYLGKTEESLSEEGKSALLKWKAGGRYQVPDYLYSGPMLRCRQTAEILFEDEEPRIISAWTEMDFGVWEGKNWKELSHDKQYQAWIDSNGTLPFPKGESRGAFRKRVLEGLGGLLLTLPAGNKKRVCAIVHGGIVMTLCCEWSGGSYFDYQVENGGGYDCRILCRGQEVTLLEMEKL